MRYYKGRHLQRGRLLTTPNGSHHPLIALTSLSRLSRSPRASTSDDGATAAPFLAREVFGERPSLGGSLEGSRSTFVTLSEGVSSRVACADPLLSLGRCVRHKCKAEGGEGGKGRVVGHESCTHAMRQTSKPLSSSSPSPPPQPHPP